MDDPFVVRGGNGLRDLDRDAQRFVHRELAVAKNGGEVGAFDVLHRVVRPPIERRADVEHGDDARVVHVRRELGFAPHRGDRALGKPRVDRDLQRDAPIEPELERFPHDAHAAAPDDAKALISGDVRWCMRGGRRWRRSFMDGRVVGFHADTSE